MPHPRVLHLLHPVLTVAAERHGNRNQVEVKHSLVGKKREYSFYNETKQTRISHECSLPKYNLFFVIETRIGFNRQNVPFLRSSQASLFRVEILVLTQVRITSSKEECEGQEDGTLVFRFTSFNYIPSPHFLPLISLSSSFSFIFFPAYLHVLHPRSHLNLLSLSPFCLTLSPFSSFPLGVSQPFANLTSSSSHVPLSVHVLPAVVWQVAQLCFLQSVSKSPCLRYKRQF